MTDENKVDYEGQSFDVMEFSDDDLKVQDEKSKYPFDEDWVVVGKGFLVKKPQASISGRVSAYNKKNTKDRLFKSKSTKNPSHGESAPGKKDGASKENPFTWVIRIK